MTTGTMTAEPAFPAPTTIEETGLAPDQIEMLLVKVLYGGESTGLAQPIGLLRVVGAQG